MTSLRAAWVLLLLSACGGGSPTTTCTRDADCPIGNRCVMSVCIANDAGASDAGANDGGTMNDSGSAMDASADSGPPTSDAGVDAAIVRSDAGCDDPEPGADRPVAEACVSCRMSFPEPGPDPGGSGCTMHSECTDGMNGRCVRAMIGTYCDYDDCFTDGDCESGELCSCDGSLAGGNRCVPSNCRTNSDCASGACSPTYGCLLGAPPDGWYCRTAADMCATDEECNRPMMAGGRCAYDTTQGIWACEYGFCEF